MELEGRSISVMGLGRSGKALVELLVKKGAFVFISDMKKEEELSEYLEELKGLPVDFEFGGHTEKVYEGKDLIIISPGVSIYNPVIVSANERNVPVIGEIELSYRLTDVPIIAVTGTNGKSTTVSLIHKMINDSGAKGILAGNIGKPLIGEITGKDFIEWIVAEISSFQLETIEKFKPRIGAALNITEDHIDRHRSMEEYINAKARLFSNQGRDDYSVFNYDDENIRKMSENVNSKKYYFSINKEIDRGACLLENTIYWKGGEGKREEIISLLDISPGGIHNVQNILASVAVACILGIERDVIVSSIKNYVPLRHRLEKVSVINGVAFIDDSKGTNPGAVIAAIRSFNVPVILIAGGKDKNMDFSQLGKVIADEVKTLVVIGETAGKIAESARKHQMKNIIFAGTLKEAVEKSFSASQPGDVVLLSPACASFDMFKSAEDRGDKFRQIVKEMEVECI